MKLKKCVLLLPLTYNDGTEVPAEVLNQIKKDIDREFDGHSVDGPVDGAYKMADGTMAYDKSEKVWVFVRPDQVEDLKTLARRFASRLKQETLCFVTTDAEVELLPPLPENGEAE